jgi:hypothetical protein
LKDEYNKIYIRNAMRKYFCESSREDRINIILRSWVENNKKQQ